MPKDDTVTVDKKEDKMGQRASNTATITFNETEIPADHLIGEENKGFKIAMMTLDRTRPGVAAMATGIARAAFEFATNYSKERVQFGVPIAMHQAIQFMIADMATKVHLSRLATWNSAVLLDQGKRNTLESSHAKRFAADTAMEVSTDAVQVYGGYGFIKDYPVEKLMRDAKIMQLYEGTSQIQRLVIARETLLPRRIEEPQPRPSLQPGGSIYAPACEGAPGRGQIQGPWPSRKTTQAAAEAASVDQARAAVEAPGDGPRPGEGTGRHRPAHRRPAAGGPAAAAGAAFRLPGAVLRQPADGPHRGAHGGRAGGQPEHDVPAAADARGRGPFAGEWEHPERRSRRFYRITASGRAELERLGEELRPRLDRIAASIEAIRAEVL